MTDVVQAPTLINVSTPAPQIVTQAAPVQVAVRVLETSQVETEKVEHIVIQEERAGVQIIAVGAQGPGGGGIGPQGPRGVPGAEGEDGLDGGPGPIGPQGTQGIQGPVGNTGLQGAIGSTGLDGDEGPEGMPVPGPMGPTGAQGTTGVIGPQGVPGTDGEAGEEGMPVPGPVGPTGAQGTIGATGLQGSIGAMGLDGDEGPEGMPVPGPVGPTGAQGVTGITGPQGTIGAMGLDGDEGPEGLPIPGPVGPTGGQGVPGTPGAIGPIGLDGDEGPEGMPVPGPVGPTGATGDPGTPGAPGAAGPQGIVGPMGMDGETGEDGLRVPTAAGSIPTGTGFVHITSGAQDAAAQAVDLSTADASGILAAARFPALTGDVTTSAGALATAIANAAVTLAKMENRATQTFIGRSTAGAGVPEELSIATAKTMLNLTGTNSGDQTITLTGDVTGSGAGSFAATIANNAVTNAKAADMATQTFKGRNTAGTGDPEDLSIATAQTMLGISAAAAVSPGICDFRLSLDNAHAVTVTDIGSAGVVNCVPFSGNAIALYDGTKWNVRTSANFSISIGTLTAALPYDVFAYDNAGVPTLEILAWTNGTTRATNLALQDGVLSKTGALTRRYMGTFYTDTTTSIADTFAKRYLWNYYHRVLRNGVGVFTANRAISNTSVVLEINTEIRVNFIIGWMEDAVMASVDGTVVCSVAVQTFVAFDSTSVPEVGFQTGSAGTLLRQVAISGYKLALAPGIHFATLLGVPATNVTTATYHGTANQGTAAIQTQLHVGIWG